MLTSVNGNFIPMFDADADGWRFLRYNIVSLGVKRKDDTLKYGFTIRFDDDRGYALLANSQCGVGFALHLAWSGNESGKTYTFSKEMIIEFVDLRQSICDMGITAEAALMLTVTGVNTLADGDFVSVQPVLTSTTGYTGKGTTIQYS